MDIDIRKLQLELRRSGKEVTCLPTALVDEMKDAIYWLLSMRIPNPNGSDYSCAFCGKELPHNDPHNGKHEDDCIGNRFVDAIHSAETI